MLKFLTGNLEVLVKSIPGFEVEGDAKVDIKDSLTELAEEVKIKYIGDGTIQPPTSFEVQCFKSSHSFHAN